MQRNQTGRSWVGKALVYTGASCLGGSVAGAILGAVGGIAPGEARIALGTLAAVFGLTLGVLGARGVQLNPPQIDRETPQRWLNAGAWRWAALNGVTLGVGAFSRIGFWLWYTVPIGSLLFGRPLVGALIYGSYGLTRGGMAWLFLIVGRRSPAEELMGSSERVRRACYLYLTILCAIGVVSLGW